MAMGACHVCYGESVKESMKTLPAMGRLVAALILAAALPAAASAQGRCSQETLTVRGQAVSIGYCVTAAPTKAPGSELLVPVHATYSSSSGSSAENMTLHFISGVGESRVIRNVDLAKIGSSGTLHLTLVYGSDATIRIESATLSPGAITIK